MKTLYAACLARLGLSQAEAASLHGVRLDTVKSWAAGRNRTPPGVWDDLRAHEAQIVGASNDMRTAWQRAGSPPIEINDQDAAGPSLIAAADFLLKTAAPVSTGRTDATDAARRARKWTD